jgi:hypothetical protein
MPKRKSLVTGLLAHPGRKASQAPPAAEAAAPRRRIIKTVRVPEESWAAFKRYVLRRQGKGEVVDMGLLVEAAIREYQAKHPA